MRGVAAGLKRWPWAAAAWVTWIPSSRGASCSPPSLSASASWARCRCPGAAAHRPAPPQSEPREPAHRLANVWGAFEVDPSALPAAKLLAGPVLLLDDVLDTGWTMTVAAALLRQAGAAEVLPFALARR